jgi:hypothetical protein
MEKKHKRKEKNRNKKAQQKDERTLQLSLFII